ncbi:MAG: P-type conjugative transfer protein TrbJ [Hyphomicrobiaceae bacterium]
MLAAFPGHPIPENVPPPLPASPPAISAPPPPASRTPDRPKPSHPHPAFEDLLTERFSPYRVAGKPNRAARRRAAHTVKGALTVLIVGLLATTTAPRSSAALTVFDPLNYQENVLAAVRALEQINNQIRQLEQQAQMILKMDQNLQRIGTTLAPDLQRTLAAIQSRLRDGEGLAVTLARTEAGYAQLYPKDTPSTPPAGDILRNAKSRWDEEYASLQRSALLQGQIADAIGTDSRLLDDAMGRSRGAAGALDVAQAGNELTALGVKQTLGLQGLIAAQSRTETLQRARDLTIENEARQRFRGFIGNGNGYTRSE